MKTRKLQLSVVLGLCLIFSHSGNAQTLGNKHGFSINQDFHDYNVALLDNKVTSFDSALSHSMRIGYNRYLNNKWQLGVGMCNGFLMNQNEKTVFLRKSYWVGFDVDVVYKLNNGRLFKVNSPIAPYLSFGYNFNYINAFKEAGLSPFSISNEYGVGTIIRLSDRNRMFLQVALDQQLNGDFDTHIQYRIGFAQTIGVANKKDTEEEKILDYDKDGIVDAEDNCPTLAGIASLYGCPEDYIDKERRLSEMNKLKDSMSNVLAEVQNRLESLENELQELKQNEADRLANASDNQQKPDAEPVPIQSSIDKEEVDSNLYAKEDVSPVPKPTKEEAFSKINSKDSEAKPIVKEDETQSEKSVSEINQNISIPTENDEADGAITSNNDEVKREETDVLKQEAKPTDDNVLGYEKGIEGYFVVVKSTRNYNLAEEKVKALKGDYPTVKILPQEDGTYWVGIYATRNKSEAVKIWKYVKNHGGASSWLTRQ
jgi:hypothetical protein